MSCVDLAEDLLGGPNVVLQVVVSRVPRCGSRTGSSLPFRRLSPRGWPGTFLPPSSGGVGITPGRCSTIEFRVRRSTRRSRAVCQSKWPFSGALPGAFVAPINAAAGQDGCSLRKPSMPSNISLKNLVAL